MDTIDIECPDCHYRRSANRSDLPTGDVYANCPRCGSKFRLPPRRPSQSPQTLRDTTPSHGSSPSRFTLFQSVLPTAAVLLLLLVAVYLFVGRVHGFNLPEEEVTVFKTVNSELTSEPATNLPVLVEVELQKRYAFYWGDGSNGSEKFKSVYFFTSTDSSGKLRMPGTRHRVFVRVPCTKSVGETFRYYLGDKDAAPDPQAVMAGLSYFVGPTRLIASPRDLICVRSFDYKPAAEIIRLLQKGNVISLTSGTFEGTNL